MLGVFVLLFGLPMAITYNSLPRRTLTPRLLGSVFSLLSRSSSRSVFCVLRVDGWRARNSRRALRDGQRSDTEGIWSKRIGSTLGLPLSYAILHGGGFGASGGYILGLERRDFIGAEVSGGSARRVRGGIWAHLQIDGCWDCCEFGSGCYEIVWFVLWSLWGRKHSCWSMLMLILLVGVVRGVVGWAGCPSCSRRPGTGVATAINKVNMELEQGRFHARRWSCIELQF